MNGDLTIGMLVAYQSLVASFNRPLGNLVDFGGPSRSCRGDMNRLDDVMRYPRGPAVQRAAEGAARAARPPEAQTPKVTLRDVSFGYSPLEPPLIETST